MRVLIQEISNQLLEIQEAKIWLGENFSKKLAMVDETEVFTRPLPNLHSIAEIISHLTIWRKETILKINNGKGSLIDNGEESWLTNDLLIEIGWKKILKEYKDSLLEVIALLENREDSFLVQKYYDNDFKGWHEYRFVLNGMLHHDIYHLGQLGIIIKLLKLN
ncbi:DinB family protein [Arenibacter sp. GZD96]|uniref:DinB family protein n=1 Tax=Aurantibrevibacter litoralis TaxID=3106030 RepID=UPI002AFDEA88|nr:DinB family protein [Arenibacter sp. GZD-96]MEA1786181.1 DinB family protein [Arenibacter sp. GZD-96]